MRTLSARHGCCKIVFLLYLLLLLAMFGCGGSDGDSGLNITGDDNRTPVEVKLVHGALVVVNAVVNDSIYLDMLVDTGSSRTHVPSDVILYKISLLKIFMKYSG
jgi:hypothetical protein